MSGGDSDATASAPARRERLSARARKSQIVQVSLRIAHERGIQAVSTQLIADTIGRSQGAVFRHFPSKESLWIAIIEWLAEQLEVVWKEARAEARGRGDMPTLRAMLRGHLALIARFPGLAKFIMSDDLRHQYPRMHAGFIAIHERYHAEVTSLLKRAAVHGSIASEANIDGAASLFFCMVQGLAFQFAVAGNERAPEARAGVVFDLFERALGTVPESTEDSAGMTSPDSRARSLRTLKRVRAHLLAMDAGTGGAPS